MLPILIIDSDVKPIYEICRKIWRENCANRSGMVKPIFLRSSASIIKNTFEVVDDSIYIHKPELKSEEIIEKTLVGIAYFLENFKSEFILRTNLSSFYSITNLLKLVDSLKSERVYAGFLGEHQFNEELISFCSGSGFLLSKDISQL